MKVVVKISMPEGFDKFISLDENELWVQEAQEKVLIDSNYKDRFNALLSLFMLKTEWEKTEDIDSMYKIMFEQKGKKELYNFNSVPDNWNMFMGYLLRLVGDYHEH